MVKTKITKIETEKPKKKIIGSAAKIIKKGGLVIYPTETCYGLGANATDNKAVNDVYRIKNRPKKKPIPIIVSDLKTIKKYGRITKKIEFLVKRFMPGPLTIITQKKETIPDVLNRNEIAFRISSHPIAFLLTKTADLPITATSANMSGKVPLYKIRDVIKVFNKKVDMILDCGDLEETKPSTLIDMKNGEPKIIREGPISIDEILKKLRKIS
jgi:L-threonylcarbamoyladenylate synthase